jgi:hypothetical protein
VSTENIRWFTSFVRDAPDKLKERVDRGEPKPAVNEERQAFDLRIRPDT